VILAKIRRSDQILPPHARAQTFGDLAGERSNGIVAHELREKGQLASLIDCVWAESAGCVGSSSFEVCFQGRRPLPHESAGRRILPRWNELLRDELLQNVMARRASTRAITPIEASRPR
jgi:hypothetical protein